MTRHLAIGDIHGCITALTTLIDFVAPRADDTIVTLGDYVDRGPDSRAVVEFIIDLDKTHNLVPLRGNHEIMLLDSREMNSWYEAWLGYGGEATLLSYAPAADVEGSFADIPDSHIDFLENRLISFYECESHFFVHAFADAKVALENQTEVGGRIVHPGLYGTAHVHVVDADRARRRSRRRRARRVSRPARPCGRPRR